MRNIESTLESAPSDQQVVKPSLIDRVVEALHGRYVRGRRTRVLRDHLLSLLPANGSVLDVGCGDGKLARALRARRPALTVKGIDVKVRRNTAIPVAPFNGVHIPFAPSSFDVVTLVDVLHHTTHAEQLLLEARRVAARWVIVKDHICESRLDFHLLRLMDWIGNARHGVAMPHNYWSRERWQQTFSTLGMPIDFWNTDIGFHPWSVKNVLGRELHLLARLSAARGDGL